MKKIYFDYASTTPTDPEVVKAMQPFFFDHFGNATSPHGFGREAQKALEESREIIAQAIGARAEEIVFTSGATESNNQAIFGAVRALKDKGNHVIVSAIEHHSVERPAEFLRQEGFQVTFVPVDQFGLVNSEEIREAMTPQTILVAVMHASNEIGTIQPIAEIEKITKEKNIPFLVDVVQTVGHIPVNVDELKADLLSMSAHKFYGPKGVGALYIRKGTRVASLLYGGDQERGQRAGTTNVAGVVGLAKAIELCQKNMAQEIQQQTQWRTRLFEEIPRRVDGVRLNGHRTQRLPNNAHFSFEGVDGAALLMSLDMIGLAVSRGSACTAGSMKPSYVLKAIGLSDQMAQGSLRITTGRWTTEEEIEYLLNELPKVVNKLRKKVNSKS